MARKFDKFLIATIVIDVLLLGLSSGLTLPVSPEIYGVIVLFGVSPLLAYLLVYRLLD